MLVTKGNFGPKYLNQVQDNKSSKFKVHMKLCLLLLLLLFYFSIFFFGGKKWEGSHDLKNEKWDHGDKNRCNEVYKRLDLPPTLSMNFANI